MEKEYVYRKSFVFKKIFKVLLLIAAGILIDLVMAEDNLIQNILVWLVYLSGAVLFVLDCLPGLIHLFKSNYKKIIIENLRISFAGREDSEQLMVERFSIKKVFFKAFFSNKVEIPADRPVEEIDDDLYNLPGCKFVIITDDDKEYNIYLEMLDSDFAKEFIKWYQGNKVF